MGQAWKRGRHVEGMRRDARRYCTPNTRISLKPSASRPAFRVSAEFETHCGSRPRKSHCVRPPSWGGVSRSIRLPLRSRLRRGEQPPGEGVAPKLGRREGREGNPGLWAPEVVYAALPGPLRRAFANQPPGWPGGSGRVAEPNGCFRPGESIPAMRPSINQLAQRASMRLTVLSIAAPFAHE